MFSLIHVKESISLIVFACMSIIPIPIYIIFPIFVFFMHPKNYVNMIFKLDFLCFSLNHDLTHIGKKQIGHYI